jgi:CDP-glucose 4,6-dehydratase
MINRSFWAEQRVFLTGHTGFKGSWASFWLSRLGARQHGMALAPETTPSLFDLLGEIDGRQVSRIADIRDLAAVRDAVRDCDPTVAIHMAAQPLVRRSYREPVETYATNVMGTVNVLEALRYAPNLKAVLVVTTDKVYRNDDSGHAFREDDPLGGHDPYSSSKAACEEVVSCYRDSYYKSAGIQLATARAGNVVGGGDWSEDRLVPDIWRAMLDGSAIVLRNPASTRPWQHVLDPVSGYFRYIEVLAGENGARAPLALNFAPAPDTPLTVQSVAESLGDALGLPESWRLADGPQPTEMKLLTLDASLAERTLGWRPRLTGRQAIDWAADWYLDIHRGGDARSRTSMQIADYEALPDL